MDGSIKLMLEPTKEKFVLGGIEWRLYKGRTSTGIEIDMLGLFRINDPIKREEFERAVCAIRMDDPPVRKLLTGEGLISP